MNMSTNICYNLPFEWLCQPGFWCLGGFLDEFLVTPMTPMTFWYFFLRTSKRGTPAMFLRMFEEMSGCHSCEIGISTYHRLQKQDWNLKIRIVAFGSVLMFGCDWLIPEVCEFVTTGSTGLGNRYKQVLQKKAETQETWAQMNRWENQSSIANVGFWGHLQGGYLSHGVPWLRTFRRCRDVRGVLCALVFEGLLWKWRSLLPMYIYRSIYTLVNSHSWLENGPFEDVFPIENGGYSIGTLVYLVQTFLAKSAMRNGPSDLTPWITVFSLLLMVQTSGEAVEVDRLSHYLQGFIHPRWWSLDFWTISMSKHVWKGQHPNGSRGRDWDFFVEAIF